MSLFVSRFKTKPHSIQIGDYDESFVVGGEANLEWYSLTVDNMGYKWQTDLTEAYIGKHKLFTHDFKWIELNAGYSGIGLTSEDFEKASMVLLDADPAGIYCNDNHCFGKHACSRYANKIPDLKFTLSNRITYTIPGHKLVESRKIIVGTGKYECELLVFNSGDHYQLGSVFLEDYYSVYDIDNFKIGIGKVVDFEPVAQIDEAFDTGSATHETTGDGTADKADANSDDVVPNPADGSKTNDEDNSEKIDEPEPDSDSNSDEDLWRNVLIFAGIASVFIIFALYCCKRRRDQAKKNSGSHMARS